MPAGRIKKRRLNKKRSKSKSRFIKPFFVILVILASTTYLLISSKFWDGDSKISIAIKEKDGHILISTLDPASSRITSISIPGNTEVELARQLGRIQLKNVWQLGKNEKLEGKLLTETITRNFKFPVYIWGETKAKGFSESRPSSIFGASIFPYKTNLKIGDRIRMGLFSLGVNNKDRIDFDLGNTAYLRKTTLTDGEEGYVISGSFPQNLLVVFSDTEFSNLRATVVIRDASENDFIAKSMGEVIEVLGAKIASIDTKSITNDIFDNRDTDCLVGGENDKAVEKISFLFSCDVVSETKAANFDLEIIIGKDFAERF